MTRPRTSTLAASLAPSLVLLALVSCRRAPTEADAPSIVRLADGLAGASITAPIDLADDEAVLLADAAVLVDGPLDAATAGVVRHDGAWVDELFAGEGPLWLAWAPVDPSQRSFWARVDGELAAADAVYAFPVPQRNDAAAYADAAHAEKILRYLRALATPLVPRPGGADRGREVTMALAADVREVLVAVRGAVGGDSRVRAAALGPRGGWLGRAARDVRSPWLRSVTIGAVTRPSVVMPSPARVVQSVRIPAGAPKFLLHAARFFGPPGAATVRITLTAGDQVVERQLALAKETAWRPLEFDVGALAGREAEVVVDVADAPGALVVLGAPRIEAQRPDPRPDVLLISLDTVRADHLSIYGGPPDNSPSLERFARSAVVFEQAISSAAWTLPAHASLFTGQQPDRHDVHRELSSVPRDLPWLVEDFRRAGYRTEAWTGGGYLDPTFGFDRGFDRYGTTDPAFPDGRWAARRGDKDDVRKAKASANSRRALLDRIATPVAGPRFLFVHTYAAHEYAAAPDLLRSFGATDEELPDLLRSLSTVTLMNEVRRDPALAEDPRLIERARLLYRASLRTADDFLGEVLAALDRSGRTERTIVLVVSDHGEELFERGAIGHAHQLHEELVHVPLVVRAPGVAPARVGNVVSITDVTPTLRTLCALEPAGGASFESQQDGRSFAPLLAGERLRDRLALAHGSRPEGAGERVFRALRGRRSKYMETEGAAGRLYDLSVDPREERDVSVERPDEARRSRAALETLVDGLRALRRDAGTANLSPELKAGLEALGYLGGGK